MNSELAPVLGAGVAGVAASVATPLAIRVARRYDFYDTPRGYRQHRAPTPLLGGAAVIGAFIVAAIAVGGMSEDLCRPDRKRRSCLQPKRRT